MAPAICGETLKRPGSLTSTSRCRPRASAPGDLAVALRSRSRSSRFARFERRVVAQEHAQALAAAWRRPRRAARPTGCARAPRRPDLGLTGTAAPRCRAPAGRGTRPSPSGEDRPPRNAPVGSDRPMMPILLPVLVRRSCARPPCRRRGPAVAPAFTARANSAQVCTRSFFSTAA